MLGKKRHKLHQEKGYYKVIASREDSLSHLNVAQKAELGILKDVAAFCESQSYAYCALGGTLLGAVRHKGFIPWDDDIDIVMPRPDYDRFVESAEGGLGGNYEIVTYRTCGEEWVPRYFCQVHNRDIRMVLGVANEAEETTPWVDVFPLDAMPSGKVARTLQKYRLLKMRMDSQIAGFDRIVHQSRVDRPMFEKAIIKFVQVTGYGKKRDQREILAATERTAKKYSYADEEWVVNLFGAYKFREMFPKEWFEDLILLPFEDMEVPCPRRYDDVLTQMYGDYMIVPPEHEKNARHRSSIEPMEDLRTGDVQ